MAKYDLIKTSKLKFARFGGLSSVKQDGYDNTSTDFHGPPAKRGFYSFVWPLCEQFLLGGSWTCWPWVVGSKFKYVRDKDGKIIDENHSDFSMRGNHNRYWTAPTKNWNKNQETVRDRFSDEWSEEEFKKTDEAAKKDWEENHKGEARWTLVEKPKPKIFTYEGELWHHLGSNLKPEHIVATKGSWVKSSIEDYRQALEREMHLVRKRLRGEEWSIGVSSDKNPFRFSSKDHLEVFIEKL